MDAAIRRLIPEVKDQPVVQFWLPGQPRGKGRPRSRIATSKTGGQFVAVYTDAETRNYEAMLRYAGEQAMKKSRLPAPLDCALRVRITAVFSIPASFSHKKRMQAIDGFVRPVTKPDWENLAKCLDGVNKIVWTDDSRIIEGMVRKLYGEQAGLLVEVWRFTGGLF